MNKIKRCLVTGISGFIGSHVAQELLDRGIEPVGLDNHYFPGLKRFDFDYKQFENHCIDIRNIKDLDNIFHDIDGVIHLAAILGTPETLSSFRAIKNTVDVNIRGSLNIFEQVKFHNIPCVYIQTGNGKNLSPYPITKDCAAEFALTYNKEFGTRISVIRGLVAYGERQKHLPVRKIFPTFIAQALKGRDITINGDGEQMHDFIYVKDLAKVLVDTLLENDKYFDRTIDGGSGHVYSVNQIAELIKQATNSNSKIVHLGNLKNGNVRMGEPAHDKILSDDSRKLIKEYKHRRVEDVIQQVVQWYKDYYSKYL